MSLAGIVLLGVVGLGVLTLAAGIIDAERELVVGLGAATIAGVIWYFFVMLRQRNKKDRG
ncbi:hypothetical protein ES708_12050 [subsurface metagenome]|jgi:threonine/homoserine efflux transporter RhtA